MRDYCLGVDRPEVARRPGDRREGGSDEEDGLRRHVGTGSVRPPSAFSFAPHWERPRKSRGAWTDQLGQISHDADLTVAREATRLRKQVGVTRGSLSQTQPKLCRLRQDAGMARRVRRRDAAMGVEL